MTSSRPSGFAKGVEWIFRRATLRAARAGLPKGNAEYDRAVDQARLLVEIARRVTEPVEALPKGSRTAVLCGLYRDAAYWALVAEQITQAVPASSDLAQAWSSTPTERLARAAGSEEALVPIHTALTGRSQAEAVVASTADETAVVRSFTEALLWDLDAPTRAVERVHVQRWTRTAAVLVALTLVVFGVRTLLLGPNLAASKLFKTSSAYADCTAPNKCADVLFHTLPQESPWVDFDLGTVKLVHRIEVTNRSDCCSERAIPLIAEVSVDDKQWVQVARRETEFSVWKANFPKQKARYVRFRVPRSTVLHFDDVAVR